jgi:hypothetical protein
MAVKLLGLEAEHLPPSSVEVKECTGLYFHSPNTGTGTALPSPYMSHLDYFVTEHRTPHKLHDYGGP